MAGAARNDDDDEDMISGINVTPLVDITLVLLIIFMVTATYIVRESIEVELPRAAHGGESVGVMLNIVLTKEPKMFVDGVEMDEDSLKRRVSEALSKDKDARAIISADKSSLHGAVVHVIDVIKGQGIGKFAINIEKDSAGPN
jgi:biopolymer transport protein ExbD